MRDISPTHSFYGQPYGPMARTDSYSAGREVTRAQWDGVEYVGHTECIANNYTCRGPRAKGTEYCIGHLKSMEKARSEQS